MFYVLLTKDEKVKLLSEHGVGILAYQSLLNSVDKEGSGKKLSITLLSFTGLVLLLGSGESLKN